MKSRIYIGLGVFSVLIFFTFTDSISNAKSTSIKKKITLFSLKYGKGQNEIGVGIPDRKVHESEFSTGLCDFWLDAMENIYFADCLNGRIKKLSNKGVLLYESVPLYGLEFMAILDNDDVIALAELDEDRMITSGGPIIGKIIDGKKIPPPKESYGRMIVRFDSSGRIVETVTPDYENNEMEWYDTKYGKQLQASLNNSTVFVDKNNNKYHIDYTGKDVIKVAISNKGIIKKSLRLVGNKDGEKNKYRYDKSFTPHFYVDKEGRFYTWGLNLRDKPIYFSGRTDNDVMIGTDVVVNRIDSNGTIIDTMTFPGGNPFGDIGSLRHSVLLDSAGNVYSLEFKKDKMSVVKYVW